MHLVALMPQAMYLVTNVQRYEKQNYKLAQAQQLATHKVRLKTATQKMTTFILPPMALLFTFMNRVKVTAQSFVKRESLK